MRRYRPGVANSVVFEGKRRRAAEKPRELSAAIQAKLCEAWGLKPGCVLVAHGQRYVFGRVGGRLADGKPWVWAWRLKKNGKTYAEPTRLDRWEKE